MWQIKDGNDFKLYTSDLCELKCKEEEKVFSIWINYKGYNIVVPMGIWGFDEEISERGIDYIIEGEKFEKWYYSVNKDKFRLFIDMIYFFISENNCDAMIDDKYLIEEW